MGKIAGKNWLCHIGVVEVSGPGQWGSKLVIGVIETSLHRDAGFSALLKDICN